jgi:hypothetical protein
LPATSQLFGPVASVVGGGIGTILVVLAAARIWPRLGQLGALHELGREKDLEPAGAGVVP